MGSLLNKDASLQVYMTLNKKLYYAGDLIQGTVHINCLIDRPYQSLNIRIDGRQEACWPQQYGRSSLIYKNSKDTYLQEFNLAKFDHGVAKGQYNFPFSIVLPSAFPSSFRQDTFNFIEYHISAYLPQFDEKSGDQMFQKILHIREPPRGKLPKMLGTNASESTFCGCFSSGVVDLSIQADVNYMEYGKPFQIKGTIDNKQGKQKIKNYKIVLRQRTKHISNMQLTMTKQQQTVIYESPVNILPGGHETFVHEVKLPEQFKGYTAIGNIIYRAYFLALVVKMGFCYSKPFVQMYATVINSSEPDFQEEQGQAQLVGWDPKIENVVQFTEAKPYFYSPSKHVDVRNQIGEIYYNEMSYDHPMQSSQTLRIGFP